MEFPRMLYKPDGEHCKVLDQDEYDRAKADGFTDEIPKDWNNTPDPATPGGTLPLPPVTPVPPAKAEPPAKPGKPAKDDK